MRGSIGVFDSGVGGITVMNECIKLLKNESFLYIGDSENVPYGNKSKNEIEELAIKNIDKLVINGVKAVVVACNTVTGSCIDSIRKKYAIPIIGVEPAIKRSKNYDGKSVVLSTKITAENDNFLNLIKRYNIDVYPLKNLAKEIEENIFDLDKINLDAVLKIIQGYDNVVLGCTHYIFLKEKLQSIFKDKVFLDGNEGTAKRLQEVLKLKDLLMTNDDRREVSFIGSSGLKCSMVFNSLI